MGANLIGYMMAGPTAIDPERAAQLVKQMMERRATLRRLFASVVEQGEDALSEADKPIYAIAAGQLEGAGLELPDEFERVPDESDEEFAV